MKKKRTRQSGHDGNKGWGRLSNNTHLKFSLCSLKIELLIGRFILRIKLVGNLCRIKSSTLRFKRVSRSCTKIDIPFAKNVPDLEGWFGQSQLTVWQALESPVLEE